jgi:hypothetical protein
VTSCSRAVTAASDDGSCCGSPDFCSCCSSICPRFSLAVGLLLLLLGADLQDANKPALLACISSCASSWKPAVRATAVFMWLPGPVSGRAQAAPRSTGTCNTRSNTRFQRLSDRVCEIGCTWCG